MNLDFAIALFGLYVAVEVLRGGLSAMAGKTMEEVWAGRRSTSGRHSSGGGSSGGGGGGDGGGRGPGLLIFMCIVLLLIILAIFSVGGSKGYL